MTGLARPIKSGKSPPSYPEYYGWPRCTMSSAALPGWDTALSRAESRAKVPKAVP
jgi:hypothetical protein